MKQRLQSANSDRTAIQVFSESIFPVILAVSYLVAASNPAYEALTQATVMLFAIFCMVLISLDSAIPSTTVAAVLISFGLVSLTGRLNFISLSMFPVMFFISQRIDRIRALKYFGSTFILGFFMIFAANKLFGFNRQYSLFFWRDSLGGFIFREALGFSHPNQAMLAWGTLCLTAISINSRARRRLPLLVLMALSIYMFTVTESRSSGYILVFEFATAFIYAKKMDIPVSQSLRSLVVLAPFIVLVVSLFLPTLSKNEAINNFLTGRPAIAADLLGAKNSISLFGNSEIEQTVLDNGYLHAILAKGVIFATFLLIIIFLITSNPRRMSLLSAILISFYAVFSFGETALLNPNFIFIICLSLAEDQAKWGTNRQVGEFSNFLEFPSQL